MRHPFELLLGLALVPVCSAQVTWTPITTRHAPGDRSGHATAHDFARGRTVVFGGGRFTRGDDTWEYDGTDWRQMTPATRPPVREDASMVFFAPGFYTLMFGGSGASGLLDDTWAWDGVDWKKLSPPASPPPRTQHAMAYDSARQRVVLFGGSTRPLVFDTWEWDGRTWTRVPTRNSPTAVIPGGSIAYDAARRRVVYFGGVTSAGLLNDTWEYDGADWVKANPALSPSPRYGVSLVYDQARRRIVMFGGKSAPALLDETWEYDGTTWTQNPTTPAPPPRRDYDLLVYDQSRQRILLYGGDGGFGLLGDTWEYGAPRTLTGTPPAISVATGGSHRFDVDAGAAHAGRLYWVFGSISGLAPGVTLGAVTVPLVPDLYTDITVSAANTAVLTNTRGTLNAAGAATGTLNVPVITDPSAVGLKLYHACLVYDGAGSYYLASNPVDLTLTR